jgi:signal transduction histidine kinase/DNA-binding response OmpR family regulator
MGDPHKILVVDDEPDIRDILSEDLGRRGYTVATEETAEGGRNAVQRGDFDALILDLNLGEGGDDGLALLRDVREHDPEICVIIITGYATADSAIEAMHRSADDYLQKPFELEGLAHGLDRALERRDLRRENRALIARLRHRGEVLREQVAEATSNLRLLLDLARGLGKDLDLEHTLNGVAERARELTHARAAIVFLRDPVVESYEVKACLPGDLASTAVGTWVASGLAVEVGRLARPLRHRLDQGRLPDSDPLALLHPSTALALPIVWEQTAVGSLVLLDRTPEAGGPAGEGAAGPVSNFTDVDEELALAFVAHAAVAIRNAQIYTEARRLDRLQSEFIAAVSHELRTPLANIKGSLENLDSYCVKQLDHRARQQLAISLLGVHQLEDQVDLILASAEVESDELTLDLSDVEARSLVEDAAQRVKPVAARKGITIQISAPQSGALVRVDVRRFGRVLMNLLSNAVKFSENGQPISVEVEVSDNVVRFHVTDRGIGIAAKDHSRIFHRFAQVDGSLTRRAGGTGLGLSVSRQLAERHGGQILVRSRPGEGSRFTVEIPAAAAHQGHEARVA